MNIEELATQLYDAKKLEDAAKKARIEIEEQIAAIVDGPESGSKTVEAGQLKVTVKRGFTYKADVDAIRNLNMDDAPIKLVPAKYELDEKLYELMAIQDPKKFDVLSRHVEVKPRKVAVTLKLG